EGTTIGPLASEAQFEKVQRLIKKGIEEGAELVTGGPGRPEGIRKGYFVKPTVFANVRNDMTIAREEIFGPVLTIIPSEDEPHAIRIANDTPYGLSGYVTSGDLERARRVARKIRSGNVHVSGAQPDLGAAFGGYKQSGNGREWGEAGLEEFLELKAVFGYAEAGAEPARPHGRESAATHPAHRPLPLRRRRRRLPRLPRAGVRLRDPRPRGRSQRPRARPRAGGPGRRPRDGGSREYQVGHCLGAQASRPAQRDLCAGRRRGRALRACPCGRRDDRGGARGHGLGRSHVHGARPGRPTMVLCDPPA